MPEIVDAGQVVRSQVKVQLNPEEAFRLFTDGAGQWWPRASHSTYGEEATNVIFEPRLGGRVYETTADGRTSEWGVLTEWQPGTALAMTWYPGLPVEEATRVEIRFVETEDGGTLVDLLHSGWAARGADAAEKMENYTTGWAFVLGRYVAAAGG